MDSSKLRYETEPIIKLDKQKRSLFAHPNDWMAMIPPMAVVEVSEAPPETKTWIHDFVVVGVSFRTAPLQIRSALSLGDNGVGELLDQLKSAGVNEALILSTCNRTEVYAIGNPSAPLEEILGKHCEVPTEELAKVSYRIEGAEGVTHFFKVASGLDSALLGETEILGQIKAAHAISRKHGACGSHLEFLYQRCLRTSKKVRTHTGLCREVVSIGAMALRKASAIVGSLKNKNVLLIGGGQIAERVAKELNHLEVSKGFICNRTLDRAERLGLLYGLKAWPLENLDEALMVADVVLCATSRAGLLDSERLRKHSGERQVAVVDLGVPPNVSADGDMGKNVHLVNMEAIIAACKENSKSREAAVPHALSIIEEEVGSAFEEAAQRAAAPIIEALVRAAEDVRRRNLDWALSQQAGESERERKLLEDLSIRIVRGMLEAPIRSLKEELRGPVERAVIARLFGVEA